MRPLRQQLSAARLHLLHTRRRAAHAASRRTHPCDCSHSRITVAGHVRRELIPGHVHVAEGLHVVSYMLHDVLIMMPGMLGAGD